jgi:DNA repair exonuclease SbcCD nuclease subunit
MKRADLIFCADVHLRETLPICRVDDFLNVAQWRKLQFIKDLQALHDCAVLCAGDVFDYWKPSPELLAKAFIYLPKQFHSIYGNHDLPNHSLALKEKCGLYTLAAARAVTILPQGHYGKTDKTGSWMIKGKEVFCWHVYNWKGTLPWPGCTAPSASRLLRQYPQFDVIVTGDNHKPFVEKFEGRILVNPGSIFRMDADQVTHKPRVYLWYADTNEVEAVYLPIEDDVITREHLEKEENKKNRLEAYIAHLDNEWEITMSFDDNLKAYHQKNKVRDSVMELVYKATDIIPK